MTGSSKLYANRGGNIVNRGSMTSWTFRGLGFSLLAGACAALLDGAATLNAAPASASPDDGSGDYTALVMGHAFLPTPDPTYIQEVIGTYVDPSPPFFAAQPVYDVGNPIGVYTPESDYGSGLTQGVSDLNTAINEQLAAGNNDIVVAGYSESDSVATQEMLNLDAEAMPPDTSGLTFVLAEDLNNPDGGFFTRLPGFGGTTLPATPADTPYTTDIYNIEYSGASDFPQYDGNTLADLNAADGYLDLHPYLLTDWPAYFTPAELAGAVKEPTSVDDVATSYYLIATQNLPMLDGLRGVGGTSPFADMIQPDLRVLIDQGYNWTGDADVDTPATMSNPDVDLAAVDANLAAGADQGMIAALVDLGVLPQSDLSSLYPYVPDILGLQSGDATSLAGATADASASNAALVADLADSTNPLAADLGAFLPGMATDLGDFFQNLATFSL
jgi:diacyltrehalose acyltransferase